MGAAIISGIVSVIVLLVIGIPVGLIAALLVSTLGLGWNPVTILLAILAAVAGFAAIFFFMGLLAAPFAVFFQAYALTFFGRRYRPLEVVLYPEPPLAPPSAPPDMQPPMEPGAAPA
jgi:hypothetical protein